MNEVLFIPRSILGQGQPSDEEVRSSYQSRFEKQLLAARERGAGLIKLKHTGSGVIFFYAYKLKGLVCNLENNTPRNCFLTNGGFLKPLANFRTDPYIRDGLYYDDLNRSFRYGGLRSLNTQCSWGFVNMREIAFLQEDCRKSGIDLPLHMIAVFSAETRKAFVVRDTQTNSPVGAVPVFRLNTLTDEKLFSFLYSQSLLPEYADTGAQLDDVLKKLLVEDKERSALEVLKKTRYEDSTQGLWSLWPYTRYTDEKPPEDLKENWFDLRSYDTRVYARNPMEDIVGGNGEYAAIDFGTTSTTVAVWYQNRMSMFQIGGISGALSADSSHDEEFSHKYENPTVLSFENVDRFLRAYTDMESCPPNTRICDVDVAGSALSKLQTALTGADPDAIGRIQSQLKQWTDDDGRVVSIRYGGQNHALRYARLTPQDPDPIEIYAYYIGLTLNNLASGKIWTDYLLSYSATYVKRNIERIRASFERGLRRSLPFHAPEDPENPIISVRQYCDEATAYAVAAFLRYRVQAWKHSEGQYNSDNISYTQTQMIDAHELPSKEEYDRMLDNGLLYGIYDFGGGTLDFSFGLIEQDEYERLVFKPLEQGGASYSGCENIMERLALRIFEKNSSLCQRYHVEYVKPTVFSEPSNYARFNTLQLIGLLRSHWRAEPSSEELVNRSFYVYNERGEQFLFQLSREKRWLENNTYYLALGDIDRDMERILENSVSLFLKQLDYAVRSHNISEGTPCCIFLGGNASRSERLKKVFNAALDARRNTQTSESQYYLHPPLPTDYDAEHGDGLPNAKSGVVYGLLHARPSSQICRIDKAEQRLRAFDYHIGVAMPSPFYAEGEFHLLVSADELVPESTFSILTIPQDGGMMELLYTKNAEYGIKDSGSLPATGEGVFSVELQIDRRWGGLVLCCAAGETPGELKIGVKEEHMAEAEWIGCCRLFDEKKYISY